jgi:hypothetical protein
MEEPNADESKLTMGFRIGTITVQNNFEGGHRWILGQVLDLNCLTWIFNLVLVGQLRFGQSRPPTPPHLSLVTPFVSYGSARGGGGNVTT